MNPLPQETIFNRLRLIAEQQKLSFLIVGGNAVNAHGYQRTTFDIDVAIPETERNTWQSELEAIGYRIYFETESFLRFKAKDGDFFFPVDLMMLNTDTYSKLEKSSEMRSFGNIDLPVPSPLHLIAMKLHALRQPARALEGKDLPDIFGLIRTRGIDVQSEEFQLILEKYGNEETRTAIHQFFRKDP